MAPFILRGVSLLGIDSVMCSADRRQEAWRRLATELDDAKLRKLTSCIALGDVLEAAPRVLAGETGAGLSLRSISVGIR